MKKYVLGLFAIVLAVGFSAYTNMPHKKSSKFTDYYYAFNGNQDATDRADYTKYINPTTSAPGALCPTGSAQQCYLKVSITGEAPTNPDFSGWTFDGNGFPATGTGFVQNIKKAAP